jgi:hypothetical protein
MASAFELHRVAAVHKLMALLRMQDVIPEDIPCAYVTPTFIVRSGSTHVLKFDAQLDWAALGGVGGASCCLQVASACAVQSDI